MVYFYKIERTNGNTKQILSWKLNLNKLKCRLTSGFPLPLHFDMGKINAALLKIWDETGRKKHRFKPLQILKSCFFVLQEPLIQQFVPGKKSGR